MKLIKLIQLTEYRYYHDDADIDGIENILNGLAWGFIAGFCLALWI